MSSDRDTRGPRTVSAVFDEPFRVAITNRDGRPRLVQSGRAGWVEPVCDVCDEPIRWVLDMMSFVRNHREEFVACHARCAWTVEAFDQPHHRGPK